MRERRGRGKRGGRGEKYGIWLFGLAWQILATVYIGKLLGTVCNSNTCSVGFIGSSRKTDFSHSCSSIKPWEYYGTMQSFY